MKALLTITTAILLSTTVINADKSKDVEAMMREAIAKIQANPNMSEKEQEALMLKAMDGSKMAQDQLQKQKKELPNVLKVLKGYRSCISSANSEDDAKVCRTKSATLAKKLGIEDGFDENEAFVWDKKQMLSEMDIGIKEIEKSLPCIQKAKNMSDMMGCRGMQ